MSSFEGTMAKKNNATPTFPNFRLQRSRSFIYTTRLSEQKKVGSTQGPNSLYWGDGHPTFFGGNPYTVMGI